MGLMNTSEIDWVLELENSGTSVGLNVPLSYCTILRRAEQTTDFESQMVNFVCMTNQWLKLVLLLELLVVIDFPKTNQAVSVPRKHFYNLRTVETECSQLRISNNFFKSLLSV